MKPRIGERKKGPRMDLKNKALVAICGSLFFLGGSLENTYAVSTINPICPVEFEGVVLKVSEAEAPLFNPRFLEKVRVTFSIVNSIKGNVSKKKELIVLKNGPVKFRTDQHYRVSLNKDFLCNVKEI